VDPEVLGSIYWGDATGLLLFNRVASMVVVIWCHAKGRYERWPDSGDAVSFRTTLATLLPTVGRRTPLRLFYACLFSLAIIVIVLFGLVVCSREWSGLEGFRVIKQFA